MSVFPRIIIRWYEVGRPVSAWMFSKRAEMGMDGGWCIVRECPNPRICIVAFSLAFLLIEEVLLFIVSVKSRHKCSVVSAGMICVPLSPSLVLRRVLRDELLAWATYKNTGGTYFVAGNGRF